MSYEWQAEFALPENEAELHDVVQGQGTFGPVQDLYARWQLLAQSVADAEQKKLARSLHQEQVTCHEEYARHTLQAYGRLGFATPRLKPADVSMLPRWSFFLSIPFTLAAPYVSKDDTALYLLDNPQRKDWVTRVPLVASASWKGAFRAALRWTPGLVDREACLTRLLGNPKGAEENLRRGRLVFFPTFFDKLGLGVINPHSRATGAGRQGRLVHFEQVPAGAKGDFALLYTPIVPGDAMHGLPDWDEALQDIDGVGRATHILLYELGFGAKTASGMGRADNSIVGAYLLMREAGGRCLRLRGEKLQRLDQLPDLRRSVELQVHGGAT